MKHFNEEKFIKDLPIVLTPEQVADVLQVKRSTVYKYIQKGYLSAIKLGNSNLKRILKSDVQKLMNQEINLKGDD